MDDYFRVIGMPRSCSGQRCFPSDFERRSTLRYKGAGREEKRRRLVSSTPPIGARDRDRDSHRTVNSLEWSTFPSEEFPWEDSACGRRHCARKNTRPSRRRSRNAARPQRNVCVPPPNYRDTHATNPCCEFIPRIRNRRVIALSEPSARAERETRRD